MVWVRLDDHFDEHPKIAQAGPLGLALYVSALAYCNRNLTDGFVPHSVATRLVRPQFTIVNENGEDVEACLLVRYGNPPAAWQNSAQQEGVIPGEYFAVNTLVECGLWEQVDGGYQIHDYEEYQPLKAQVLAERAASAERQKAFRQRHVNRRNAVSNGVSNGPVTPAPVPDPVPDPNITTTTVVSRSNGVTRNGVTPEGDFARAAKAWEDATGQLINPRLGDNIADAIAATSIEWTLDAIKATGDAGVKGWRYTQAILDRWQRDGRQATPSKNGNGNTPSGPLNPAEIAASNAAYGARIRENSPPVVYPEGWLEKESARNLKMLEEKYGVFEGDTGKASTNGHKVAGLSRRVLPEVQALPPASNS